MTRKKLLIATDSFLPRWDGISRFLSEIIPHLAKDFDITVLAPNYSGSAKSDFEGVKIIRFPILGKVSFGDYPPARAKIRIIKEQVAIADVVFTHTIGPIGALTVFEAWRTKKPVVSYIHSIEWELFTLSVSTKPIVRGAIDFISRNYARLVYNRCTLLLVPSREIGEFITHNGIKTQKKVLHMGTDVSIFSPTKDKEMTKRDIGLDPAGIVIGYAGRLGREKDLVTLYRAFLRVQKQNPSAQLLIVGDGVAEIKKMFSSRKGIFAVGKQDSIVSYYQAMDIFVLPSLTETTSLVTIEAMSCGVPVIATPVGYVKSYVRPGFNGFLFPRKNSFALASKLQKLIADKDLRETLGKNARRTALTQFSWDKRIIELKQVFDLF